MSTSITTKPESITVHLPLNVAAIAAAIYIHCGICPILWGGAGIGKTTIVYSLARLMGRKMICIIPALREPSDFLGLPCPEKREFRGKQVTVTCFATPAWAFEAATEPTLVFFDEVSTAAPAIQSALLRIILEKVVGEFELPDETRLMAAANPPGMATGGWELAAPLANRFGHLHVTHDPERWRAGMVTGVFDSTLEIPRINAERFEKALARKGMLIGAYTKANPADEHGQPEDISLASLAWPSPRTWEMCKKVMAAFDALEHSGNRMLSEDDLSAVKQALIKGLVGDAAGHGLMTYELTADLKDPEDILKNPALLNAYSQRPDLLYASLSAVTTIVEFNLSQERYDQAWKVIAHVFRTIAKDHAVLHGKKLLELQQKSIGAKLAVPELALQFSAYLMSLRQG